jgi:hypothetical protein
MFIYADCMTTEVTYPPVHAVADDAIRDAPAKLSSCPADA